MRLMVGILLQIVVLARGFSPRALGLRVIVGPRMHHQSSTTLTSQRFPRYCTGLSAEHSHGDTIHDNTLHSDLLCVETSALKWLRGETLSSMIAKDSAVSTLRELKSNPAVVQIISEQYNTLWTVVVDKIRAEKRSTSAIVGDHVHKRILDIVEGLDPYDPQAVQTFLSTPVFENMLGSIIYEAIFEFLKRVDIIGNVLNKLPIIGPIKVLIDKEFKQSLDRTLGMQIKAFLATFNRTAVQRMVDFVLSTSNREALRRANRNAADVLLNRPVSQLLPADPAKSDALKKQLWSAIANTTVDDLLPAVNFVYGTVGDTKLDALLHPQLATMIAESTTLQALLETNVRRFTSSLEGVEATKAVQRIAADNNQQ